MGSLMLTMEDRPILQQVATAAMEKQPKLFASLLAFHVGGQSMRGSNFLPLPAFGSSHNEGKRDKEQDHEGHHPKAVLKT